MKSLILVTLTLYPILLWALDCPLKDPSDLGVKVMKELSQRPLECRQNAVHMTFDDGPSATTTLRILDALKRRNIKATFFITTTNLKGHHKETENRKLVARELEEGHLIANHGHDHSAHDLRLNAQGSILEKGFSESEKVNQLSTSIELLNQSTQNRFSKQKHLLFRFPYGRGAMPSQAELQYMNEHQQLHLSSSNYAGQLKEYRNQSPALQTIAAQKFSHLGWNHDSGDSSLGAGIQSDEVIQKFILKNLRALCAPTSVTKIALFHDIKELNVKAIPLILDIGQCLGLKFISPDEMIRNRNSLEEAGVLISKKSVDEGPIKTLDDVIAAVMKKSEKIPTPECAPTQDKTCFSEQYNMRFPHCSGGDSICFEGRWYSKTDPIVIDQCNLPL